MAKSSNEFETLMARIRAGCPEAAQEVFERYNHHVQRVVRRTLGQRLRRQYDSADFAQSTWASFFLTAPEHYTFRTPEALVGFLARVAYNKVVEANRHRLDTAKHDLQRELSLHEVAAAEGERLPALVGRTPTPSQVAVAAESFEQLVDGQPPEFRRALEMLRQGHSQAEVAKVLGIHPKLLQRVLQKLRKRVNKP
jgi:RNA polymerase sigma factor (sigma-70 family)